MFDNSQFFSGGGDFYSFPLEQSLRFNDDDGAYLSWTPDSAGNRKTWTWSGWVKRGNISEGVLFSAGTYDEIRLRSDHSLQLQVSNNNVSAQAIISNAVLRDPSAWYHIVMACDMTQATAADRLAMYINGEEITSFSTDQRSSTTQNQLTTFGGTYAHQLGRDESSAYFDGYLADVHFIDGQAKDADDFGETKNGVWVAKDYTGTYGTNGFLLTFEDDTEVEAFNTTLHRGNGGTQSVTGTGFSPDLVWIKDRNTARDSVIFDTVRGATNYLRSASTGAEGTSSTTLQSFDSDGFTVGNNAANNNSGETYVAWQWDAGANNAVTGHSSVTYTGNSTVGHRISGLPFRPDLLWLKIRTGQTDNHVLQDSVRGPTKRLFTNNSNAESTGSEVTSFTDDGFILGSTDGSSNYTGFTYVGWAWDAGDGDAVSNTDGDITSTVKSNGDFSIISYTGSGGSNHTIGHGLSGEPDWLIVKDRDSNSVNNNWSIWHRGLSSDTHNIYFTTGAEGDVTGGGSHGGIGDVTTTTFKAVDGSVDNKTANESGDNYIAYAWRNVTGKQKFGSYTGNGAGDGSNEITVGFRPGFVMVKRTDSTGDWWMFDASRDSFNPLNKRLFANKNNTEDLNTMFEFHNTSFKLRSADAGINANGGTYIYAAFAGSYSDYITDYNTDGSIDSRVKADDTTGFSVVSYTGNSTSGATVGHGLSSAPDWIVIKSRTEARNWVVWHTSLANTKFLYLNTTDSEVTKTNYFNSTSPSASVVTLGNGADTNNSGQDYIAYCWTATTGRSAFGSYTGNGSATGPTVTTGFKPAFLMIKRTDSTHNWYIFDSTRTTTNPQGYNLMANSSAAEDGPNNIPLDFLSNGFQPKGSGASQNASGGTYIYAAFADTREAAFWLDQSGNDNDWQPVNLDHNDTVADSPTDNFATLNPLSSSSSVTLSEGNLKGNRSTADWESAISTIGISSGKFYAEVTWNSGTYLIVGASPESELASIDNQYYGYSSGSFGYGWDGKRRNNASTATYGDAFAIGDVIGIAVDMDNGYVYFSKNGVYQNSGDPNSGSSGTGGLNIGTSETVFVGMSLYSSTATINFGQQPFVYGPPE